MAPRRAAHPVEPSAPQLTSRAEQPSPVAREALPRFPSPEPDEVTRSGRGLRVALALSLVGLAVIGLVIRALPAVAPGGGLAAVPAATTAPSADPKTTEPTPSAAVTAPSATASAPAQTQAKAAAAAKAKARAAAKVRAAAKKAATADDRPVRVPATGPGTYAAAEVHAAPASARGTLKRYDVRVEHGLDIDPEDAAGFIEEVLNDKRSWRGSGSWRFELVRPGEAADLHAYIATPGTTDKLCAPLNTRGEVSCQNGAKVVLNAKRWMLGVSYYGDDVTNYRRYLVNHEFGHALGHQHVRCPGSGRLAPVMMQQTKGLGSCRKNPWPYPSQD